MTSCSLTRIEGLLLVRTIGEGIESFYASFLISPSISMLSARSCEAKTLLGSRSGRGSITLVVLWLMQERANPRPIQPETDHRKRTTGQQDFDLPRKQPPPCRHFGRLQPAHDVEPKPRHEDQPRPVMREIGVPPHQGRFLRLRTFWQRHHREIEQPHGDIEPIKTQKDHAGQYDMPPRPRPEPHDFAQRQQDGEPSEQPHPRRLDWLLTPWARRAHTASHTSSGYTTVPGVTLPRDDSS